MGTKALTSRVRLEKGKCCHVLYTGGLMRLSDLSICRFGWVNASYVYGLEILNAHMQRALGAITPYETYKNAIDKEATS